MQPRSSRRPSPALVISIIALIVAVGSGSAVALNGRNTVDSGDIKPKAVKTGDLARNAVNGAKVRQDSLTGSDIDEARLGQVPNAANAEAVDGASIVPINHRGPSGVSVVVATINGLSLSASCVAGEEQVTAQTTTPDSEISAISNDASVTDGVAAQIRGQRSNEFGPGETLALGPENSTATDRQYTVTYSGGDGRNVVAIFATEDDIGGRECVVGGYAIG